MGGQGADGLVVDVTPNFKAPRIRSKAHLAYVASLHCAACRAAGVQVHHLLSAPQAKARGLKASDSWTVPLCQSCHTALHSDGNERRWFAARDIDQIALAEHLWSASVAAGRVH